MPTSYMKELHSWLMELSELNVLLKDSIAKSICIDTDNIYITLRDKYHNIKMYVNKRDFEEVPIGILVLGNYEESETDAILNMIQKYIADQEHFTFLDIGANVGWYTLNVKKSFNNAQVYSIEPSPETFDKLKNNLLLNNETADNAYNIGFYDKNDKLDFYFYEDRSGASSLRNTQGRDVKTISIDVERLDDWVKDAKLTRLDFIKCDVEGAEFFVYKGGAETLKQYTPIVFSEMLRKWSAKFGYTPNDIISFFSNLGYGCYVISGNGKLRECSAVTEETVETNYFFLHKNKHSQIIRDLKEDV